MLQTKYLTLYSWGLMVAIGYLAALLVSMYLAKREKFPAEHILSIYIYTAFFAMLGARLFFVIQFFSEYLKNPLEIIMIQRGGFVFLGGFIAAFIAIYVYTYINKLDPWKVLDMMAPGVMLGYAIGRIGCFLNGCCYGTATKVSWGLLFPGEVYSRHPTQLYSVIVGIAIFVILMAAFRTRRFSGQVFLLALLCYSVYRFLLEFFRYSPVRPAGLTPSQYILIIMFGAALFLLWKKKNTI